MIQCTFEDGNTASLRHVTVAVIVYNEKNQILITKRAPYLLNGNKYCLPSGFLDRDENTQQAALRELEEETGIKATVEKLFNVSDNPSRPGEDRQNVDIVYIAKYLSGEPKLNKEVTEILWVDEDSVSKIDNFAFDHKENILYYFEYCRENFSLPLIGGQKQI